MDQVSRLQARVGMLEGELNGAANGKAHDDVNGARPASEATKVSVETQSGQHDRPESRW
jgi:hypothetical protein